MTSSKIKATGEFEQLFPGEGEVASLMRSLDWSRTKLGAPSGWPDVLKTSLGIVLNAPSPMALWWGPDLVVLYNDAWRPLCGKSMHPQGLGRPGAEYCRDMWTTLGPPLSSAFHEGRGKSYENAPFVLDRNGYDEEAYFTHFYCPVRQADGATGGFFAP